MPRPGTWGRGIAEARHRERQQARLERQQREREEGLRSTRGEHAGSRPQERRWQGLSLDAARQAAIAARQQQRINDAAVLAQRYPEARIYPDSDLGEDETEAFLRTLPPSSTRSIIYTYSGNRADELRRPNVFVYIIYNDESLEYARLFEPPERKFIDPECFKHMDKALLGKLIEAVSGQSEEELLGIEGWDEVGAEERAANGIALSPGQHRGGLFRVAETLILDTGEHLFENCGFVSTEDCRTAVRVCGDAHAVFSRCRFDGFDTAIEQVGTMPVQITNCRFDPGRSLTGEYERLNQERERLMRAYRTATSADTIHALADRIRDIDHHIEALRPRDDVRVRTIRHSGHQWVSPRNQGNVWIGPI